MSGIKAVKNEGSVSSISIFGREYLSAYKLSKRVAHFPHLQALRVINTSPNGDAARAIKTHCPAFNSL